MKAMWPIVWGHNKAPSSPSMATGQHLAENCWGPVCHCRKLEAPPHTNSIFSANFVWVEMCVENGIKLSGWQIHTNGCEQTPNRSELGVILDFVVNLLEKTRLFGCGLRRWTSQKDKRSKFEGSTPNNLPVPVLSPLCCCRLWFCLMRDEKGAPGASRLAFAECVGRK